MLCVGVNAEEGVCEEDARETTNRIPRIGREGEVEERLWGHVYEYGSQTKQTQKEEKKEEGAKEMEKAGQHTKIYTA